MNHLDDTIAAIATGPGQAGIAIVRMSGPSALSMADRIFRGPSVPPSEHATHSVLYGHLVDDQSVIDEVLLLLMHNPRSFTGEDMVEVQCHGGPVVARRILRTVLATGARLAEPGEFTRRAFLNGRIDLLQAEAVLDIVQARSDRAAEAAVAQLDGGLSAPFNHVYENLLALAADHEALLDFPDDEMPPASLAAFTTRLHRIRTSIDNLLRSWDEGQLLRSGARVVISGTPNVGKSTLLNALLDTDRAIVSHVPGTTRDTIEEGLVLDGIPIQLVDTAGLRETPCDIEREGIARTLRHMETADLHLYLVDASRPLTDDDARQLAALDPAQTLVVLNKVDLGAQITDLDIGPHSTIKTSLLTGEGLSELRSNIRARIEHGLDLTEPPHAVISERHRQHLLEALSGIHSAQELLAEEKEDMIVLSASHLRNALEAIGQATGRNYGEDVLANIFSRFCIGK